MFAVLRGSDGDFRVSVRRGQDANDVNLRVRDESVPICGSLRDSHFLSKSLDSLGIPTGNSNYLHVR